MRLIKRSLLTVILLTSSACSLVERKKPKVFFLESATTQPVRLQAPNEPVEYPLFCVPEEDLKEIAK